MCENTILIFRSRPRFIASLVLFIALGWAWKLTRKGVLSFSLSSPQGHTNESMKQPLSSRHVSGRGVILKYEERIHEKQIAGNESLIHHTSAWLFLTIRMKWLWISEDFAYLCEFLENYSTRCCFKQEIIFSSQAKAFMVLWRNRIFVLKSSKRYAKNEIANINFKVTKWRTLTLATCIKYDAATWEGNWIKSNEYSQQRSCRWKELNGKTSCNSAISSNHSCSSLECLC